MTPLIPKQVTTHIHKVLILGAECTGKTTLAKDLAHHFGSVYSGEYMRTYLEGKPKGYVCQYEDLLPIAIGQINQENRQIAHAKDYLFCDTGLFEIASYAHWYFQDCPPSIEDAVKIQHYDLILLTDEQGIPWQADGMRDLPNGRDKMRQFFIKRLQEQGLNYHPVYGDRATRVTQVATLLQKLTTP
ncbi:ATP-binding protein [Neisseria montereyensis]|uniref:ATP-binding protein n=1 Tax=Neisseria montereyensis TaxID=2973938 RepID=A0ABT2FB84_9NEIS|nr:ATP-binding protein [Neisseria montereyensis]MCS4532773.1 ATP-binding protein [Neisseria montereyensis]